MKRYTVLVNCKTTFDVVAKNEDAAKESVRDIYDEWLFTLDQMKLIEQEVWVTMSVKEREAEGAAPTTVTDS